nr:MAG TPA: hypothetical protein [Caudoviricetes sp.]
MRRFLRQSVISAALRICPKKKRNRMQVFGMKVGG